MANAADSPGRMIAQQVWSDLQPFDGRLALTWRVALLCALVAGVAMMHKIPESAISCYLIIFLMHPNGAECFGKAVGLIVLVTLLVVALVPVIQLLADTPLLRIAAIAGASFVFLYLSSATQLGEIGAIIGLVIAFILTMVDLVPAGEIVTRGLLYAWAMACMPMALMAGFALILGTGPHTLLRQTVAARLTAAAGLLQGGDRKAATVLIAKGQAEVDNFLLMTRAFHTASRKEALWLAGAAAGAYKLLLASAALPADTGAEKRDALAQECQAMAARVRAGKRPALLEAPATAHDTPDDAGPVAEARGADPLSTLQTVLRGFALPNGGSNASPAKVAFVAADALTNPDHQRYALKTTAAALLAYFAYSLLDWEGIATAMVTCYVAALGSTGETVHKLALRIIGCLIGAAIGVLSILFVIPQITSVGGLMVLVFCAILPAAWVSTGNERISYGGVQIGLAFLLTVLTGFGPSLDMSAASDRIIGILLGNALIFVMFTNFWPKSAIVEAKRNLSAALMSLAGLADMPPHKRTDAVNEIAAIATHAAQAKEALDMTPFEPRSQRPGPEQLRRLYAVIAEIGALLPILVFSNAALSGEADRLRQSAATLDEMSGAPAGGRDAASAAQTAELSGIPARTRHIAQLVAG